MERSVEQEIHGRCMERRTVPCIDPWYLASSAAPCIGLGAGVMVDAPFLPSTLDRVRLRPFYASTLVVVEALMYQRLLHQGRRTEDVGKQGEDTWGKRGAKAGDMMCGVWLETAGSGSRQWRWQT